MHRIDTDKASATLPTPQTPGPNVNGFFQAGTKATHDYLNALQEETCYMIEQASITLDKAVYNQLFTAVQAIIAASPASPSIDAVVEDLTPKLGGNLDVNGFSITSISNGDVIFSPLNNIDLNGNILVHTNIVHEGDADNLISFGTNTQDYQVNGVSQFDITNSGLRIGGANARVNQISTDVTMAANSSAALFPQITYKDYINSKTTSLPKGDVFYMPIFSDCYQGTPASIDMIGWGTLGEHDAFSRGDRKYCFWVPFNGTIKKLRVNLSSQSGTSSVGDSIQVLFTVYKNFAATSLLCGYSGVINIHDRFNLSDLTHSVPVVVGDNISVRLQILNFNAANSIRLLGGLSLLLE